MLDTVIKIGQLYRQALDAHRYHEQINKIWDEVENLKKQKNKDGNPVDVVFYNLPVIDNENSYKFNFDNISIIEDEDIQKRLYRFNFKTSGGDSTSKYLFGDIVHSFTNSKKQNGTIVTDDKGSYKLYSKKDNSIYLRENKSIEQPSFYRASPYSINIKNKQICEFRKEYEDKIDKIHQLLEIDKITVVHFDFENKNWFELDGIIDFIDFSMVENFVENSPIGDGFVLNKSLYKSLIGGEFKYYSFIPNFDREANAYKGRTLSKEELLNIVYAKDIYTHRAVKAGTYNINVMPYYENISIGVLKDFFNKESFSVKSEKASELKILNEAYAELEDENDIFCFDEIFSPMLDKSFNQKVTFDISFIWLNPSNKKYEDFVEIGTVEYSYVIDLANFIEGKALEISIKSEKDKALKYPYKPRILKSFASILKNKKRGDTLYNRYIIKVLPKVYLNSYYEDDILLPAFIEQLELKIRDAEKNLKQYEFYTLKYDFYFLMNIQKNNNLMKITQTKSYALGKNLGIMARQFAAWRDDCPIKSFEKSYVGNLSRRITTIDELVKFAGFINEKLTIHDKLYPDVKNAYLQLVETIDLFEGEKYNKHNCALGFFESYYGKKESTNEEI